MEKDYDKAFELLKQVVLRDHIRFAGVDYDLEQRLSNIRPPVTYDYRSSPRTEEERLEVMGTLEVITKDANLIDEAMSLAGKEKKVISIKQSHNRRAYVHFYVNHTSGKYEHDQIVTDRDLLTGEWKITHYSVPSSRTDEFFERIEKGDVTFHAGHIGRMRNKPLTERIGAIVGAALSAPAVIATADALGGYNGPNFALIGMIPLAGIVLGLIGGRKLLYNPAREFLEDKKEGHHGFGYLIAFCAPPVEERGIPYVAVDAFIDAEGRVHNPK